MVTVLDVAKYILEKQGKMSVWKLQKLCYYSQAWHCTWTVKRLIEENFQAWRNDPVCPELFNAHKGKFMVEADAIKRNSANLTADEKESVDVVLKDYGTMKPFELSALVRSELPWQRARKGLPVRKTELSVASKAI